MKINIRGFLSLCALFACSSGIGAQSISPCSYVQYEWSSVTVVGGGFVDGIICYPKVEGLRRSKLRRAGVIHCPKKSIK